MPRYLWDVNTHLLFDDEQQVFALPEPPAPPGALSGEVYWELWIDLENDGLFQGENDRVPPGDIISVEWSLGLTPHQPIARPARATIVLDNTSGKYSPERSLALEGFEPYRAVRLVSGGFPFSKADVYGNFPAERENAVTEQVMFTLRIVCIEPEPNRYGESRAARVVAEDTLGEAANYPVTVPLQIDKFASQILQALLEQSGLYPPGTIAGWILGQTPLGETRLGLLSEPTVFDLGTYVYPYAMDTNEPGARLYDAIRYVVETENGRFFINRQGQWEFWDRAHTWVRPGVSYRIDDDMSAMDYEYGSRIANIVEVKYTPRTISDGETVLATLSSAVSIPAYGSTTVNAAFKDANGSRLSSTSVIKPVGGTDYTAKTRDGYDVTGAVSLEMSAYAQSAQLTFTNGFFKDVAVQAGMTIRGENKVTAFDEQSIILQDTDSINTYGRKPYPGGTIDLRFVDTARQAVEIARDVLDAYAVPRGAARRLRFYPRGDPGIMTMALKGAIGSRVSLSETQTGHTREYFAVGEEHALREGGLDYRYSLVLEPAQDKTVWILGHAAYSVLGSATIL